MMQVELREAVARGAKFIEVRLDFLLKAVDYKRLQPYKGCPWMATFRVPADGGRFAGTEPERQTLLRQAIVSGLYAAHAESRPLDTELLMQELRGTRPLSVMMAEQVQALRKWARERTVPAD
jgi:3-dehydroquinate dehydratase